MTEASDELLITLVRTLAVESTRFVDVFSAAHALHPTDMTALSLIETAVRAGNPMTPGALSRALNLSASATTSVLDRLERAGHASRDRSATDRRKVELRMNDSAQALAAEFFHPLREELQAAWQDLGADERQTIAKFLGTTIAATTAVREKVTGPNTS